FVEMDLLGRLAVDFAFSGGHALEDRDGFLLGPVRNRTAEDQALDFGESAAGRVRRMFVLMFVWVLVFRCNGMLWVIVRVAVGSMLAVVRRLVLAFLMRVV